MSLIPREPYLIDPSLTKVEQPWRKWLGNHEQTFLTDNQLSAWMDEGRAGCERLLFYPLPFPHEFGAGCWDFAELSNHDSLRSIGPHLEEQFRQAE